MTLYILKGKFAIFKPISNRLSSILIIAGSIISPVEHVSKDGGRCVSS